MVDNSAIIRKYVPEVNDGDSFIYTEMLDRSKTKGNNSNRLLKSFYHRSKEEFDEQLPVIKKLCDEAGARAYTRIGLHSWKKVGKEFTKMVVEASLTGNFAGMKSLYRHAAGTVKPLVPYWFYDVDDLSSPGYFLLLQELRDVDRLVEMIPSRRGMHLVCEPFDIRKISDVAAYGIVLHKNNPTNLYIPDSAD